MPQHSIPAQGKAFMQYNMSVYNYSLKQNIRAVAMLFYVILEIPVTFRVSIKMHHLKGQQHTAYSQQRFYFSCPHSQRP
jgi:hypothetical protein